MSLGSTQPLTEMSKGGRCYGWHPNHLHEPIVLKSGSLNFLEPLGPVQACLGIALPFKGLSTPRKGRDRLVGY